MMPTGNRSLERLVRSSLETVLIYWERRLIIVFLMGFASGLPFLLSGATLSIWLTEAGVSLTTIGLFALVGTPYNFKFLWAPLIDRVPIPVLSKLIGRRRAWMIIVQLGLMAAITTLGLSEPQTAPVMTALLALAVAFFLGQPGHCHRCLPHRDSGRRPARRWCSYDPGRLPFRTSCVWRRSPIPRHGNKLVAGLWHYGCPDPGWFHYRPAGSNSRRGQGMRGTCPERGELDPHSAIGALCRVLSAEQPGSLTFDPRLHPSLQVRRCLRRCHGQSILH